MNEKDDKKGWIVLVDDNRITLLLLSRYLEVAGYKKIVTAINGVDCLKKVNDLVAKNELISVIISDTMMPRMDGFELAIELKKQPKTREIPLIIVSALNDVANQLKSIKCGADDFLSKPIEEALFLAKVKLLSRVAETDALLVFASTISNILKTKHLMMHEKFEAIQTLVFENKEN